MAIEKITTIDIKLTPKHLVGRDPTKGRIDFRTGAQCTRRQRQNKRGDKHHTRELAAQLKGE